MAFCCPTFLSWDPIRTARRANCTFRRLAEKTRSSAEILGCRFSWISFCASQSIFFSRHVAVLGSCCCLLFESGSGFQQQLKRCISIGADVFIVFRVLELCAIHQLEKRWESQQEYLVFGPSVAVGFAGLVLGGLGWFLVSGYLAAR